MNTKVKFSEMMFCLINQIFKQHLPQDAVLYRIKKPSSHSSAMRSNKEQEITQTTYIHNSYRGRPSSHISESIFSSKKTIEKDLQSEDTEEYNIKKENSEKPVNLCLTYHDNKPSVD